MGRPNKRDGRRALTWSATLPGSTIDATWHGGTTQHDAPCIRCACSRAPEQTLYHECIVPILTCCIAVLPMARVLSLSSSGISQLADLSTMIGYSMQRRWMRRTERTRWWASWTSIFCRTTRGTSCSRARATCTGSARTMARRTPGCPPRAARSATAGACWKCSQQQYGDAAVCNSSLQSSHVAASCHCSLHMHMRHVHVHVSSTHKPQRTSTSKGGC